MGLRESLITGTRNAGDVPIVPVATPEWPDVDGQLFVRMLSAFDADLPAEDSDGDGNYRARYLCRTLCDANRKRVLSDEDAIHLGHKEVAVVDRLFRAAAELNGMTESARSAARKNSPSEGGDGSPSSSPEPSTRDSDST